MNHTPLSKNETSAKVLAAAARVWRDAEKQRRDRQRFKRFTYGDQWSDTTTDADGATITHRQKAKLEGKRPMSNNLIRKLVKCVVGRFRMLAEENPLSPDLADCYRVNNLDELDSRALEEFLISGKAIQRVVSERRPHGDTVWVDNVNPDRFFINAISDPRAWDAEIVGMIHDMSLPEVIMRFARGDTGRASDLRQLYSSIDSARPFDSIVGGYGDSFLDSHAAGRCRVIEVWTLESRQVVRCHDRLRGQLYTVPLDDLARIDALNTSRARENQPPVTSRLEVSTCWHCRWLAPDATILDEFDSPDGAHPFIVKFYPLTDGEVHSLVEDVIDQQIYINRLITLIDHIIGTSAKGALLFPVNQLPKQMSWQELASSWAAPDAIIPYVGLPGSIEPHQISCNASDIGARELLSLEMKMFEEVSGVTNALMGKSSGGGNVGAQRYESEVKNATVAINDLIKTFDHFRQLRDDKIRRLEKLNIGNLG